ncbi:MAG: hypothetical protein J6T38_11125 [Bacteroidaceae bacterium]|nr:hypothetical protein [Bacteroidaceae bacterium]
MSDFFRILKTGLKNAQHFSFIHAFITLMDEENWSAAKIVALLQQLKTAFSEEDRWYMVAKASEIIAQRNEADRRRDDKYSRLYALIRAWAGSDDAEFDAAATTLLKPFKLYKVKVNAQLEEETGQMDNLITDISTPAMQAHLATLHATGLFEQMCQANEEVKTLRREQGVEMSEKVVGALRSARKNCDQLYDGILDLIEAFAMTAEDPAPYEAFIKKWNGTLKIYQDMLDRKSGTSSSSSSSSGSSSSNSGTSQQGGTNTEPATEPTTEPGDGGENGGGENTNPTNPDNGGGSGGGDNGGGSDDVGEGTF